MDKRQLRKEVYQALKDIHENTTEETFVPFTLRLSERVIKLIDENRKKRPGKISRNQWIVEAIQKVLALE